MLTTGLDISIIPQPPCCNCICIWRNWNSHNWKMSKLSPSLKALISAPFARPNTLPAPPRIRAVYERLRQDANSRKVGRDSWLTLSVSLPADLGESIANTALDGCNNDDELTRVPDGTLQPRNHRKRQSTSRAHSRTHARSRIEMYRLKRRTSPSPPQISELTRSREGPSNNQLSWSIPRQSPQ